MNQRFKTLLMMFTAMFFSISVGLSQGATTATITGVVSDGSTPLVGAVVKTTHQPTNAQNGSVTNSSGRFTIPNLRVGGPYTVSISYVGYEDYVINDLFLSLGEILRIEPKLVESGTLEAVVVTIDPVMNSDRTGAATNIDRQQIDALPSISRSAQDFTRLTPSSSGNSFGGRNNQFNNFSLDGSIFNNPFGLDAATPGGQAEAQAVSLDAIDQIQVSEAPYDVTQAGFTGASVNAVTKSGTNKLHGTAFYFTRNQDMTGDRVNGDDIFVPDLTQRQFGASIGGPVIKDRLFFFANFERDEREDLGSSFFAQNASNQGEGSTSRVLESDLIAVQNALAGLGYDTGAYQGYTHETPSDKGLLKFDWNVSDKHTVTATYNFLDASKQKPAHPSAIGRRGPDATTLQFANSGYQINNKIQSGIIEWKGNFGSKFANKFQAGYTHFDDFRNAMSAPAPVININKDGIRYIVAGHEPFSINNRLDQKVIQLSDNFNMFLDNHTLTFGSSFEKFSFDNSFNLGTYDPFPFDFNLSTFGGGFASVQDFLNDVNSTDSRVRNAFTAAQQTNATGNWALAETNVGQFALYAQDEFYANDNLKLTFGLRGDLPLYFDTATKIQENIDRNCCYDGTVQYYDENGTPVTFDHTDLPKQKMLVSPRLGFNWDARGDNSIQVRGGSGVFTGRFPFVWVGNQVANPNTYFYNKTANDFQFPQVWRTNVGVDRAWDSGLVTSFDVAYTDDLNAMIVRNYGIKPPTGTLAGVDNRPVYTSDDVGANAAYVFTNSNEGRSWNLSAKAQKQFDNGLFAMLAYNFNDSKDVSSIPAEISSDAYDRNPVFGHANDPVLANSLYGNRHRVIGSFAKKFEYGGGKFATSVGLFTEYAQGGRYSFVYAGDLNNDGAFNNDLIYVPTDGEINQMNFVAPTYSFQPSVEAQRTAYKQFIAKDDYLRSRRGRYAEKYASLLPWYNTWDLKLTQDFAVADGHTFQFTANVLNLGNLLNSNWGVREVATNNQPIAVSGFDGGVPVYSFNTSATSATVSDFGLNSRWQAQVGLRYKF